ncbi:MAG: tetratricopeptide repeat protein, partial [Candidatus Binatia bacterium]
EAYGDLRRTGSALTAAEREAFASPTTLADLARDAKERPAERVAYLAGLELVAAGDLRDGVAAFERIGISSPYYRYGLFSAAQALFASDDLDGARRKLRRLAMLPARRDAEVGLAERAHLLEAQILFAAGDGDAAIRAASDAGAGPFAFAAQLLRGEICLESGSPSLAVAYLRDAEVPPQDGNLDTRYALGLGAAYRSLGDVEAASTVLRGASARLGASRAGLEGASADAEIERLHVEAESLVAFGLERDAAARARVAGGIRRVVAFKGPMNLGKLVRVIFTSHENTIVGEPVYDTRQLAEADPSPVYRPKRPDALWRAYLASAERQAIESALRRGMALATENGTWLASDTIVASPGERSARRRRRIVGEERDEESAAELVSQARSVTEERVTEGLRRVVRGEAESIRRLQYEVDVALSQALAHGGDALRPER